MKHFKDVVVVMSEYTGIILAVIGIDENSSLTIKEQADKWMKEHFDNVKYIYQLKSIQS